MFVNMAVEIRGRIPDSLKEPGDAAFARSSMNAQEELGLPLKNCPPIFYDSCNERISSWFLPSAAAPRKWVVL